MALMFTGTATANAASTAIHGAGSLMLSIDNGDFRVADGTHTFAGTPDGFILVRKSDLAAYALNLLTGYTSGAGTVAATDTILQAIQKLNGNVSLKYTPPLASLETSLAHAWNLDGNSIDSAGSANGTDSRLHLQGGDLDAGAFVGRVGGTL